MSLSIGLYVPTPVPPARGGFERLVEGLQSALEKVSSCTRVEIPVDERSWEGVLQGYRDFYEADTSSFDLVISTKGPSYLIQHPYHICYLVHRLRVFYDMYEQQGREHAARRELIHQMDRQALDPVRTRELFCIGKTVQKRLQQWGGFCSEVIYPATNLEGFHCSGYEHFLFVSRFHRWKRGDLVIQAYRKTKTDVPLFMVGAGPDEEEWKRLAEGDSRIVFPGQVSQSDLFDLYARALAVVFPPINEDFGYITIESMLSQTPVITCIDSGEPAEFVQHKKTGLVSDPTVNALASQLQYCADHPQEACVWGAAGCERVKEITWDRAVERMLEHFIAQRKTPKLESRPKEKTVTDKPVTARAVNVLVSDNQILTPAVGGGRVRISYLYRYFPETFGVDYVGIYDYLDAGNVARRQRLSDNFHENIVSMTALHALHLSREQAHFPGHFLADVLFPEMAKYSPRYQRVLDAFANQSDVLIASHPWSGPFLHPEDHQLLVYDSHNCEAALKWELLKNSWRGRKLAENVRELEGDLCHRSDLILVCSASDGERYVNDFQINPDKIVEIPNGVDTEEVLPATDSQRQWARQQLEIDTQFSAVFVGSAYGPNTEAVEFIADELLDRFPNMTFLVVGSVRDSYLEVREKKGREYRPSISRTGLGEGWYHLEDWGQPVRWTKQEAVVGVVPDGDAQLAFDCQSSVRKRLDILLGGEVAASFEIEPDRWVHCALDLQSGSPNAVLLRVSKTHTASNTDPRRIGVAVANMRIATQAGDIPIPIDGEVGSDIVGDRLRLMGVISDEVKQMAFHAADIALNPIFRGSGSNIKMFDYLAGGLPVVTTPVGARGIDGSDNEHYRVADRDEYVDAVEQLLQDAELRDRLGAKGRDLAVKRYDWRVIALQAAEAIAAALLKKRKAVPKRGGRRLNFK